MKKELDQHGGVDTKIKLGAPGALDVFVDGRKVFSYQEQGRIPSAAEVLRANS